MKRTVLTVALAAAAFALASCGSDAPTSPVRIADAVVTLPAVPGRPGAAYFRIESDTSEVRITAMSSPKAQRIELHESQADERGMMRMRRIEAAAAAPGAPLVFEPGGKHAMLFGLDPGLKPGDRLPLVIQLDPAGSLSTDAEIRRPGAAAHGSH